MQTNRYKQKEIVLRQYVYGPFKTVVLFCLSVIFSVILSPFFDKTGGLAISQLISAIKERTAVARGVVFNSEDEKVRFLECLDELNSNRPAQEQTTDYETDQSIVEQ